MLKELAQILLQVMFQRMSCPQFSFACFLPDPILLPKKMLKSKNIVQLREPNPTSSALALMESTETAAWLRCFMPFHC